MSGSFYLRAQKVKLLHLAVLYPALLPAARAEAPAYSLLAQTDPNYGQQLFMQFGVNWNFLCPRGAGASFQVGWDSAVSTGGCRALHISSHLVTTSLSDSKGRKKGGTAG